VPNGETFLDAFACPACRVALERARPDALRCPGCATVWELRDDIWRFLPRDRAARYERFIADYQQVRAAERYGSDDAAYYRALPFAGVGGQGRAQWRIRARSFRVLRDRVIGARAAPLRIVDAGSGNGWLSNQLASLGHHLLAVDLIDNGTDGLGARRHYQTRFESAQAELDHLPLGGGSVDLVVFNASFHYATDYRTALVEARRVLAAGGRIVVLDSPIFHDEGSGRAMVSERQQRLAQAHGAQPDALASEGFLTWSRIDELGASLRIDWTILRPFYGLAWALSPLRARVRGRREPARFALLVGTPRA